MCSEDWRLVTVRLYKVLVCKLVCIFACVYFLRSWQCHHAEEKALQISIYPFYILFADASQKGKRCGVRQLPRCISFIIFLFLKGGVGGTAGWAVGWPVGWAKRAAWTGRTDIPARLTPARPVSLTLTPCTPCIPLSPHKLWTEHRYSSACAPLLGTSLGLASLARKTACCDAIFSALGMSNTHSSRHPLLPIPMFTNTHYCQKPHFSKAVKKIRRYHHLTSTLTTNTPSAQTHISFTIYHLSHVSSLLLSTLPCQ